jgi:hypothetical protein
LYNKVFLCILEDRASSDHSKDRKALGFARCPHSTLLQLQRED